MPPGAFPLRPAWPIRLAKPPKTERLVRRSAYLHTGQAQRDQAAGLADLHHDVLKVMM